VAAPGSPSLDLEAQIGHWSLTRPHEGGKGPISFSSPMMIRSILSVSLFVLWATRLVDTAEFPWGARNLEDQLFLESIAHDKAMAAVDHVHQTAQKARYLQQDPSFICEQFQNASNGLLQCGCSRYDRKDVLIECDYTTETCNADESICFNQSVAIVVNEVSVSEEVMSCTYFSTYDSPLDTCIKVTPDLPGRFNETITCEVSLNGEKCNYCVPCNKKGNITISFDCCNIEPDIKSTCQQISEQGATIPQFDYVSTADAGKCDGINRPSSAPPTLFGGILLLVAVFNVVVSSV